MADDEYEQKVKDMQKYIPFLENLIKTLKNNKGDKRVAQLTKMQMLYGLLTNKEKKLKLITLEKCETVLMRLHSKVEKTDLLSQGPSTIAEPDDICAPESPSNSDSFIEFTNPIVIPTERRQSPPPRSSSHHRHSSSSHKSSISSKSCSHSKELLYDRRDRPRSSSSSSTSRTETSPELFRRRSPKHDRSTRYEDDLRKKYERPPPLPKYDHVKEKPPPPPPPEDDWDEPRTQPLKTRHIQSPAEVLSSPPLSLDDINNLMNESGAQPNRTDPRVSRKDHNHGRSRDMPMTSLMENPKRASPKPVEMPVRLAYKYNPHPRRSIEKPTTHSRGSDHDQYQVIAPSRTEEIRTINTLPSVNPSDPRLRNRPMPLFMPDNNCPQSPLPNIQSPNSPMPSMHSVMDRMSNHSVPDNIKSPVYGNQPFYGNFQQQQPVMHLLGPMHSAMFMQPQNPYMQPQPRTYGEYRKARLTDPKSDWSDPFESPMKNAESPVDSTTSSSPSYLDNMYKNSDYQQEASPNGFGFKIPKLKRDLPGANRNEFFKDSRDKPSSWNSADKNRDNVQFLGGFKEQITENWDNCEENWDNVKSSKNSVEEEENWDDVISATPSKEKRNDWDNNEENWNSEKPGKSSTDNEENWDTVNENWDNVEPTKPPQNTEENWDKVDENWDKVDKNRDKVDKNWDNVDKNWDKVDKNWDKVDENWDNVKNANNTKNTQNWDNLNKIWNKVQQSKIKNDGEDNWDNVNENWGNVKQNDVKPNQNKNDDGEENWDNVNENWDNVPKNDTKNKEKDNWDDLHENWDDDEEEIWDTIAKNDNKSQESNKHSSADPRIEKHKKDRHSGKKKEIRSDKTSEESKGAHDKGKQDSKKKEKHGEKDRKISVEREKKKHNKSFELAEDSIKKSDVKKKDKSCDEKNSAQKKEKHSHKAKDEKPDIIANNLTEEISSDSTDFTDNIYTEEPHLPQTEARKSHGKRKSETKIENVPKKLIKTGNTKSQPKSVEAESEVNLQGKSEEEKPEPIVAEAASATLIADELMVDTETSPTTLINSSISTENIIEGRRRTRGSYSRFLSPQVSPEKTSPSPKKPKRTYTKRSLNDAQECSVSSTTVNVTTNDEKPVERKKTKKQLAEEQKAEEEAEAAKKKAEQEEAGGSKKDEITKEWLEGVLLNLFNPAMMGADQVLGLLQKVLPENKFEQVKNILSPDSEKSPAVEEPAAAEHAAEHNEESHKPQPKQNRYRKKTELDRLNEDIRDMFISQGVLTATGRRMCTVINEKHEDEEIPPNVKEDDQEATLTKSAVVKAKPKLVRNPRGRRNRRKGVARMWNAGSKARAMKQRRAELEAKKVDESLDADLDGDYDVPLAEAQPSSQVIDDAEKEEHQSQNAISKHRKDLEKKSISMLDSSIENAATLDKKPNISLTKIKKENKIKVTTKGKLKMQLSDNPVEPCFLEDIKKSEEEDLKSEYFEDIDPFADLDEEDEKKIIVKTETVVAKTKRRGNIRGKPGRKINGEMNEEDAEFKNTNSNMHVQSEYATKCSLCPFAGRYLSNHYVHFHPLAEVLISRLPPSTQMQLLLNEGNSAISSARKPPNKTVYLYACPFCEGRNSFTRKGWIEHFGTHTGEYNFKCSECSRMLNLKQQIMKHIEKHCPNAHPIRLRTFFGESRHVFAYICDLCNYVQMTLQNIVNHLRSQHDCSEDVITKVTLLDCNPIGSGEPLVEMPKGNAKKDNLKPADPGDLTNTDRNMEVFMPREQNDLNLDTNFMKFMSDISFSATGSPPLQSTMSVADRINERFKNTNTNPYAADSLQDTTTDPDAVRQPPMSMTDRLSERFSGASRNEPNDDSTNDSTKDEITKEDSPAAIVTDPGVSELQNKSDDVEDVILLSDGDDDSNGSLKIDESVVVKNEKTISENSESGTECDALANDDDDEWVDIETPPSPSCLDSETKSSNSSEPKPKKNKTIYATLSRLYASIVPKAKKKAEPSSTTIKQNTSNATATTPLNKKTDQAIKHRINNLGYSKTSSAVLKYNCLVESCSFLYSDIPDGLESHVIFEHPNLEWDGYCHACSKIVATDLNMKLTRELQHMQQVHIDAEPSTSASSSQDTEQKLAPLALKLRRLPGDTLSGAADPDCTDAISKQLSPHPLQISSAVSLNKASAIWQPVNMAQTQDKQPSTLPIVIKQVFSGGTPKAPIVSPPSNLKITKISPPVASSQSSLKIAKITGAEVIPLATSTSSRQHPQLKIASVSSAGATQPFAHITNEPETLNINEIIKLSALPERQVLKEFKPSKLKPWTLSKSKKSDAIVEKLLQEISLYALFKCMGNECDFVTSDSEKMIEHLGNHAELQKRLQIETNAFSWLECCYCNIWTGKISKLISHIIEKHGHDIYQCPYCYYRSCESFNLIVHLKLLHANMEQSILVCFGEEPNEANELVLAQQGIKRNVKHINCYDCTMVFDNPVEYSKHIETHNPDSCNYKCFHCLPTCNVTAKYNAVKHLTWKHNIACYECVNCSYACVDKLQMNFHMANCHASNSLFCCVRISMLENSSAEEIHTTINNDLALILLKKKVDPKYLQFCPYTKLQLNVMDPKIKDPEKLAVYENPRKLASDSIIVQKPGGLEIAQVQTITTNVFNEIESPTKSNDTQSEYESMHTKILAAAKDIVQNTGVNFSELYSCGMPKCFITFQSAKGFKIHMAQKHPTSSGTKYPCFHCDKTLATIAEYAFHYAMHEKHRYFCFLCFHTAPSVSVMVQHVARVHGIRTKANIVTYPLLKGLLNGKTDFFFVCSTAVKGQEISRFGDRLLKMWERKQWSQMKKSFTPDEIDELPRQAIFFDELYCAICQYRTKVRTNLFRHLQLHKNDVKVANIDPVNPVPCLSAPERHFDKMTNLACSSHTSKSAGTNSPGSTSASPTDASSSAGGGSVGSTRRVEHVLPEFVACNNRFICGISDCSYLSINELMLKQHLSTLHSSEKNYTCPHCDVLICANKLCAEKIIHHLKFHDTNLYQCRKCGYLHFHKPVMERHHSEKHANENTTYLIYYRTENSVQKFTSEVKYGRDKTVQPEKLAQAAETPKSNASSQKKWQCTLCKTRTVTQNQIATHINIAHNIKYRYQCSKCNVGGVLISAITDHAKKKHPNKVSEVLCYYMKLPEEVDDKSIDTTPLWRRDPNKVKNIRGILMEEESIAVTTAVTGPANKITVDLQPFADTEIPTKDSESIEEDSFKNLTPESRMCHICSHILSSSEDLHNHIFDMHSFRKSESLNKIYKFICYFCKASSDTFIQSVKHWKVVHKNMTTKLPLGNSSQGRPFWFKVVQRYMCSLCSKTDEYRQIAIHHYLDHPGQVFATRDAADPQKCGHCSFTFESNNVLELCDHYQAMHLPAEQSESSAAEPPIPKPPTANIPLEDLEKFMNLGRNDRIFKCRGCFMVFLDAEAFNTHDEDHRILGFELLPNTKLYKCPTCNYITQCQQKIINHIFIKLRSSNMQFENSAQPTGFDESLRPYVLMEIVFPNGFIVERYKIAQTQFGDIDFLEVTIKKLKEQELSKTAITNIDGQPGVSDDESTESSNSTNRLKRRMKKSTTKTANIDQFESDDEYKPIVRKKFKSAAAILSGPKEEAAHTEPFSYYGTKPTESDLDQVIANVSLDGKDVTIPALDFPNFYKKEIQINLQKININDGDEAGLPLPVTESNVEPMDSTTTTETKIDEAPSAN